MKNKIFDIMEKTVFITTFIAAIRIIIFKIGNPHFTETQIFLHFWKLLAIITFIILVLSIWQKIRK